MKQSHFKHQHPNRFHDNTQPNMTNRYNPEANRSFSNTLQPQGSIAGASTIGAKKNLREILEQNNLYDEVLGQINNRLTMRETSRSNAGAEASQKKSSNSSRYRSVGGRSGNVLPSIRKPPSSELAR